MERLARGPASAPAAIAVIGEGGRRRRQPVCCLLERGLREALAGYLAQGGRKLDRGFEEPDPASTRSSRLREDLKAS